MVLQMFFRRGRKSPLAETELRFYLSMGSKTYGFALVFIRLKSKSDDFAQAFIGFGEHVRLEKFGVRRR